MPKDKPKNHDRIDIIKKYTYNFNLGIYKGKNFKTIYMYKNI